MKECEKERPDTGVLADRQHVRLQVGTRSMSVPSEPLSGYLWEKSRGSPAGQP